MYTVWLMFPEVRSKSKTKAKAKQNSNQHSKQYYCCKFLGLQYLNFHLLSYLIVCFCAGSGTICKQQSLKPTLQPDRALAVAIVMREEKTGRLIFWSALTEQLFYVRVPILHLYSLSVSLSVVWPQQGPAGTAVVTNLWFHFIFSVLQEAALTF